MGIINGFTGNASEIKIEKAIDEFGSLMASNEGIEKAYQIVRDAIIFTNKRMIFINKQGITGKKTSYHSIPYRQIRHFSVESLGYFDLDAELKIWTSAEGEPVVLNFNKTLNVYDIQALISEHI